MRLALLLLVLASVSAPVSAFGGDGNITVVDDTPENPESACSDGIDTDGDGLSDDEDLGCTKPYFRDFSELDRRDVDASWIMSDNSAPSYGNSPSVFFSSFAAESLGSSLVLDTSNTNTLSETYLEDSDETWAGGEIKRAEIQLPEGSSTSQTQVAGDFFSDDIDNLIEASEIVGAAVECGDATRDTGEDNFNCPEDMGLPDDLSGDTTVNTSRKTVTEVVGNLNIESFVSDTGAQQRDTVTDNFEPISPSRGTQVKAKEYQGGKSIDLTKGNKEELVKQDIKDQVSKADEDTTVGSASDYIVRLADDGSWKNNPDFYMESPASNVIKAVYVNKKGSLSNFDTSFNSPVETHYLRNEETKRIYEQGDGTLGESKIERQCTELDENATCVVDTTATGCPSPSDETFYRFENGDSEDVDVTHETQVLKTSDDGPSYSDSTTQSQSSVSVTRYGQPTEEEVKTCPSDTETINTGFNCPTDGPSEGCDIEATGGSIIEHTGEVTEYWDYGSKSVDFRYEDLEFRTTKVFDTNPAEKPSGLGKDLRNVFFSGDPFDNYNVPQNIAVLSSDGRAYYSPESAGSENQNSRSVSRSLFQVTNRDGEFKTKRESYSSFDVDGSGQGIGFVAYDDRTDRKIGQEQFLGTSSRSTGDSEGEFTSPGAVQMDGDCPGDLYYCVGTVNITLEDIDQWDSSNPSSGIEFGDLRNAEGVNESYSTCRFFQLLVNNLDNTQTPLRCQYDNDKDFPEGPTPAEKPRKIPRLGPEP